MTAAAKILITFVLIFVVVPVTIYMYDMPYESWLTLFSMLKSASVILVILAIVCVGWKFFSAFVPTSPDLSIPTPLYNDNRKTGDAFDPNSVQRIDGHTVKVKTKLGRIFVITKTVGGRAAFQELDHLGRPDGPKVVGDEKFGDFNGRLARYIKHKVEDVPDERHEPPGGWAEY